MKKITFFAIFLFLISTSLDAQVDQDEPNTRDQVINDDLIVKFSLAVGNDAIDGENFGFTTIKLKENNLRIGFDDTSISGSFPDNDWEITINDSDNGGDNYFGVTDVSAGIRPFTIQSGAGANALFVKRSGGNIGLGTNNPVVELHVVDGDSPTMRIEQDASSGFTPQTWDVAGNETNFFVRDVTNGSLIPFKIRPGCPTNALYMAANGNIGLGTANPQHKLEVVGDAQVNSFFYFGDESTDGNWRVSVITEKLTFEKREAGSWIVKIEMD